MANKLLDFLSDDHFKTALKICIKQLIAKDNVSKNEYLHQQS